MKIKNSTSLGALPAILFSIILSFCMIFSGCTVNNIGEEGKLLRIHIRADSNAILDQEVKMLVKEAVVGYLEDKLKNVTSISSAIETVNAACPALKREADRVLGENGMNYTSRVKVCSEYFPTRVYENVVVESGVYDALIIELGEGRGDNWWCVIYPPLCFVGRDDCGGEFAYKSRIAELWRRFISRSS